MRKLMDLSTINILNLGLKTRFITLPFFWQEANFSQSQRAPLPPAVLRLHRSFFNSGRACACSFCFDLSFVNRWMTEKKSVPWLPSSLLSLQHFLNQPKEQCLSWSADVDVDKHTLDIGKVKPLFRIRARTLLQIGAAFLKCFADFLLFAKTFSY